MYVIFSVIIVIGVMGVIDIRIYYIFLYHVYFFITIIFRDRIVIGFKTEILNGQMQGCNLLFVYGNFLCVPVAIRR